uniref:Uncharacterized protein n=1 Tax=Romanomermis culicivorax TaxID=13658 RepID=A0A915K548_ROMCU
MTEPHQTSKSGTGTITGSATSASVTNRTLTEGQSSADDNVISNKDAVVTASVQLDRTDDATRQEDNIRRKLFLKVKQAEKKKNEKVDEAKDMNKKIDEILAGLRELIDQGAMANHDNKAESLRLAVEELRRKLEQNTQRNDDLDTLIDQLRNKIEQRRYDIEKYKIIEAENSKPVLGAQNDPVSVLRTINQSLNLVNRRMNSDYHVNENAEAPPTEVRSTLDRLLTDVIDLNYDFQKLNDDLTLVKRQVGEHQVKLSELQCLEEDLNVESRKITAVGDPNKAETIDPANYNEIQKILAVKLQENIDSLKKQTDEILGLVNDKMAADKDEFAHKADLDKQLAVLRTKISGTKEAISKLIVQNDFLRSQLNNGGQQSSPFTGYASDLIEKIRSLNVEQSGELSDEQTAALLDNGELADPERRELNTLSAEINDVDEKIMRKRRELYELNENIEMEREMLRQRKIALEKEIDYLEQSIAILEKENQANVQQQQNQQQHPKLLSDDDRQSKRGEVDRLQKLEKEKREKLKRLEKQAADLEQECQRTNNDLQSQLNEANVWKARLRAEDIRKVALEDKLASIKQRTSELDRKLEIQREKTFVIEKPVQRYKSDANSTTENRRSASQPPTLTSGSRNAGKSSAATENLNARIQNLENNRNQSKEKRDALKARLTYSNT